MANDIVRREEQTEELGFLGRVISQSGMFEDARDEARAIVKVLAGRELGFGPIASQTGIHVIKGRVTVGANLMAAAVKGSGKYDYRVSEMASESVTVDFYEQSATGWEHIGSSTFTAADARAAGTQNMQKYARNMLFARAISNGVRWFCPDVFGGAVYTPEEMGAAVDGEGELLAPPAIQVERAEPQGDPEVENAYDKVVGLWERCGEIGVDTDYPDPPHTLADARKQYVALLGILKADVRSRARAAGQEAAIANLNGGADAWLQQGRALMEAEALPDEIRF